MKKINLMTQITDQEIHRNNITFPVWKQFDDPRNEIDVRIDHFVVVLGQNIRSYYEKREFIRFD